MKKFLKILLTILVDIAIIGGVIFVFRAPLQNIWNRFTHQYFPCSQPITYSIGTFDTKFGISEKNFLSAVSAAEAVWEKPVGKDLFAYKTDGSLKINLVYDIRQEATAKLQKLGLSVKDDQSSYDQLKAKYNALKASYATDKTALDAKVAAVEVLKSKYESAVNYSNSHGGASKDTYATLEQQRSAINAAIDQINQMQNNLNAQVDEINALAVTLNGLATTLNITADKYNQIGGQLGGEFEEGDYESDANGERINIYQFDNQAKLVRVLAHELGHALGLDHVEDPKAIMYRLNNGINEKLTATDLTEVKTLCKIK